MLETELQLSPLILTPSEALALFTAASNPALSRDHFYADDLRSGLSKLALVLTPEPQEQEAQEEADPEQKDPERKAPAHEDHETSPFLEGYAVVGSPLTVTVESIQRPNIEMIRRAMASNRKLHFYYWSSASDKALELIVAPYDLRQFRHDWYLLGQCDTDEPARLFKINRMRALEILPDRFRYPRRFSADTYFARALEQGGAGEEEIQVRLRFSPDMAAIVLDSRGQQLTDVQSQSDGSLICTLQVHSLREILWWILSYGADVEVLEPLELRGECSKTTRAMAQLYAEPALPDP